MRDPTARCAWCGASAARRSRRWPSAQVATLATAGRARRARRSPTWTSTTSASGSSHNGGAAPASPLPREAPSLTARARRAAKWSVMHDVLVVCATDECAAHCAPSFMLQSEPQPICKGPGV
eukprot:6346502-Prymnesium_polylepis.1